jgi:DNA-binding FadR family transcriptional regulator
MAKTGRGNFRIPPDLMEWVDAQLRVIELKEGRPKAKTPELFRRMMACYERERNNKTNNLEQPRDYPRSKNTNNFIDNAELLTETGGTLSTLNSADQELLQTIFQALLRRFGAGVLLLLGELLSDATDSFDTTQAGNTDYAAVAASLHERLDALLQRSREDRERADRVISETGGATEDRIRDSGTNKKSA